MTAYNVVNPSLLVTGQPEDISQVLANFNAIASILNGGIDNSNVSALAGILYSKLALTGQIQDADIAAGQNLKKLATVSGTPDGTKFFRDDGSWQVSRALTYRKNTVKQVVNTVTETDLLNGEITIGAGVIGATGQIRFHAWGYAINNSGAGVNMPIWRLKLGTTTLIATPSFVGWTNGALKSPWLVEVSIDNLNATNSQDCNFALYFGNVHNVATNTTGAFTAGDGMMRENQGAVWGQAHAVASEDTSTSKALQLTIQFPSAASTIEADLTGALVEVL